MPEIPAQRMGDHMRHRCGQFHAGGARADEDKRHLTGALSLVVGRLGRFERAQNLGADCLRVAQVFETWRIQGKLIVAEIARTHSGGDHQEVERNLAKANTRATHIDRSRIRIYAGHLR